MYKNVYEPEENWYNKQGTAFVRQWRKRSVYERNRRVIPVSGRLEDQEITMIKILILKFFKKNYSWGGLM